MPNKPKLKIDIYTDVICPWCYLGKRRLENALDSLQLKDVELNYLPFELRPDTPAEGLDRVKYLQAKYGGGLAQSEARITAMGSEMGLEYHFEKVIRMPNTFNAHRVIWLAGKAGIQKAVVEALHQAYFTYGKDIGDKKILLEVSTSAGLESDKVEKLLNSDEGSEEVRSLEERAYSLGVSGVPFFVFNDASAISGAQPIETFTSILQELTS